MNPGKLLCLSRACHVNPSTGKHHQLHTQPCLALGCSLHWPHSLFLPGCPFFPWIPIGNRALAQSWRAIFPVPCNPKQEGCAIFPKEVVLSLSKILPLRFCVCWWLEHVLWVPTAIYSWQFVFARPFANENFELEWCPSLHSRSAAHHMLLCSLLSWPFLQTPEHPLLKTEHPWSRKCGI